MKRFAFHVSKCENYCSNNYIIIIYVNIEYIYYILIYIIQNGSISKLKKSFETRNAKRRVCLISDLGKGFCDDFILHYNNK